MALGFGATLGVSTTDKVVSPYTGTPTTITISARYQRSGAGGNSARIVSKGTATETLALFFSGGNTTINIAAARGGVDVNAGVGSGNTALKYITNGSDTALHHILVSWNIATPTSTPTWALDGVTQTNNVFSNGSGTRLVNAESWVLGNSATGIDYFDGTICDVAIWGVGLSNFLATAKALNLGLSPLLVQGDSLVSYMPLIETGGRDYIAGAVTTTGTAYQNHLKGIQWPSPRQTAFSDLHYTLQPAGTPSGEAPGLGGLLLLTTPAGAPSTGSRGADAVVPLASPAGAPSIGSRGANATLLLASPSGSPSWEATGADAASLFVSPSGRASGQGAGANASLLLASPAGAVTWEASGSSALALSLAAAGVASTDAPGLPALAPLVSPAGVASPDAGGASLAILAQATGVPVEDGGSAAMGLTLSPVGVETGGEAGEGWAVPMLSPAGAPSLEASGLPGLALLVSPPGPASDAAAGSPVVLSLLPPGVSVIGGARLPSRLSWDGSVAGEVPPGYGQRVALIECSVSAELLDAIEVIP